MQFEGGQLFAERYLLNRLLGRGGFSVVWLAEDQKTGLKVALKIYAPGTGLDEDGIRLFALEFSLVFDLNHSNLLRPSYYDSFERQPYLVMPYCERGSALKLVGNITEEEAWHFLHDVAAALEYLHRQQPSVIHQDIKPDNVLVDAEGRFLVTDFGISTKVRSTLRKSVNVARNESSGTTAYMGPERFGKNPAPIMASDIWSLGATLYELLTGDVPFGNIGGVLQKNGAEIPDIGSNYSDALKCVVEACLAKETWNRPTAGVLREYVEAYWRGEQPKLTKTTSEKKEKGEQESASDTGREKRKEPVYSAEEHQKTPSEKGTWWVVLLALAIGLVVYLVWEGGKTKDEDISVVQLEELQAYKDSLATADSLMQVTVRRITDSLISKGNLRREKVKKDRPQESSKPIQIPQTEKKTLKKNIVTQEISENIPSVRWSSSVTSDQKRILSKLIANMVKVEGGSFKMGSDVSYEQPIHQVTLSDYYIGKYEVRQSEWKAVMGTNPSYFKGEEDLPVDCVSWEDCQKFIKKLRTLTGLNFKLPTEAQWEYAARGGKKSRNYKYSGSNDPREAGWYAVNSGDQMLAEEGVPWEEVEKNRCRPHPVGQKLMNELGLYDMSGNVSEWCSDRYGKYSADSQTDPLGPASGSAVVSRGGFWGTIAWGCRVSSRAEDPGTPGISGGLRLVL